MIAARNPGLIECPECGGITEVQGKVLDREDAYQHCPLCGSDTINVTVRRD